MITHTFLKIFVRTGLLKYYEHFCIDGKEYFAQWNDLVKLYKEDKNDPIRLTN